VLKTGYTAHMLSIIKKPITIYLPQRGGGSRPKVLGSSRGVSDALVTRCMKHFKLWTTLVRATLAAEFPGFEILQTFSIFNLSPKSHANEHDTAYNVEVVARKATQLRSLAGCLRLDAVQLESQMADHQSLAEKLFISKKLTVLAAWREALLVTQRSLSVSKKHPCDELRHALMRLGAWGGSTGGVERLFSEGKAAGMHGRSGNINLYIDELYLISDKDETLIEELVTTARGIWVRMFGLARTGERFMRADCNKRKGMAAENNSKPSLQGSMVESLQIWAGAV
jgi:hypothetical protein